jgi:hypothetical protein
MSFTQADLDAIDSAIKSGTLRVEYQDKKVQYRSLSEMKEIRNLILKDLNTNLGKPIRVNTEFIDGF